MKIDVYYLGTDKQPYARIQGSDSAGSYELGVIKNILGFKKGFDQKKAWEDALPAFGHTALELTLALFSTDHSIMEEEDYNSVAMACLTSNEHLPKVLQHPHHEYLKAVGKSSGDMKSLSDLELTTIGGTLLRVEDLILERPNLYNHARNLYSAPDLQQGILHLHNLINKSSIWPAT
jgi:hypothetical protein